MSKLIVDAALGEGWEAVGDLIQAAGLEDSSGLRRALMQALAGKQFPLVSQMLRVSESEAERLREVLVRLWGEPDSFGTEASS